jgi:ATP-dependent Clp protease adaptor protein ClpS
LPEPEQKTRPKRSPPKTKEAPKYHVVLWNDDDHSYEYVIEMMIKLFSHSAAQAYEIAWQVDKVGKAVTCTVHKELAELRCEQIKTYGPDVYVKSARQVSMRATIEEAPA